LQRRIIGTAIAALAAISATTLGANLATAGTGTPPGGAFTAGPPYTYMTELMGELPVVPLKNQAMIWTSEHGYVYEAGQQDSHLVVEVVGDRVRFTDTGTREFKKLADGCRSLKAKVGVAAECAVPAGITTSQPLLLEIWPRLGDDFVDASSLPATIATTVLGDKGTDVARLGAGPDFFNGFTGRDRVSGGAGNDWLRPGQDDDHAKAGAGDDQVVSTHGNDRIFGGTGNDRLYSGPGADQLAGGGGIDTLVCGPGRDRATSGIGDRRFGCE
jgi:serralysin